jgi:ribosomal protein L24E
MPKAKKRVHCLICGVSAIDATSGGSRRKFCSMACKATAYYRRNPGKMRARAKSYRIANHDAVCARKREKRRAESLKTKPVLICACCGGGVARGTGAWFSRDRYCSYVCRRTAQNLARSAKHVANVNGGPSPRCLDCGLFMRRQFSVGRKKLRCDRCAYARVLDRANEFYENHPELVRQRVYDWHTKKMLDGLPKELHEMRSLLRQYRGRIQKGAKYRFGRGADL